MIPIPPRMILFLVAHDRARKHGRTLDGRAAIIEEWIVPHRDPERTTRTVVEAFCTSLQTEWRRK